MPRVGTLSKNTSLSGIDYSGDSCGWLDYEVFSHAIAQPKGGETVGKSYLNWRCQVYPLSWTVECTVSLEGEWRRR